MFNNKKTTRNDIKNTRENKTRRKEMQKCLGIYIENNLIKYAKVSKEKDSIKIESFGIRFFENLISEIKKIVEETFSFNTPISINLANEKYLYFDVFALLSKKDIEKTVETEFETYCEEQKYNRNALETRYALIPKEDDKEKIRTIDIYANKIELNRQAQPFEGMKLTRITPLPMAIGSIARLNRKENQLIINMEETTTITQVFDRQVYDIETLNVGSKEVLENINRVENSYAKAYEICKNTTIYTADVANGEEQEYLQYIIPTIFKIAQRVQEIANENPTKFQTVYLTGTLATVNNIDLYFQEFLPNIECKILKPRFVEETTAKINVKDYIEVNSAIALAVSELGEGIQGLNFKKLGIGEQLSNLLKIETKSGSKKPEKEGKSKINISFDFKGSLSYLEVWLVRIIISLILVMAIFSAFSKLLSNQMLEKESEIENLTTAQNAEISTINGNKAKLTSKTSKYKELLKQLQEKSDEVSRKAARKNAIPNLLNQVMHIIPEKVQITSIQNTIDKHVKIVAQSQEYDQLGYFIAKIKAKNILKDTVSSSGVKNGGIVVVTIEGELP